MPTAVNILPVAPAPARTSPAPSSGDGGASKFNEALDQARQKDSASASKPTAPRSTAASSPTGTSGKSAKAGKTVAKAQSQGADESESVDRAKPAADPARPTGATLSDGATAESEAAPKNPKVKPAAHPSHSSDETQDAQVATDQQPADIVTAVNKDPGESSGQPKDQPGKGSRSVDAIEADDGLDASQDPETAIPGSLKRGIALTGNVQTDVSTATGSASTEAGDGAIIAAAGGLDDDPAAAPLAGRASAGSAAPIEGSHTALHAFSDALGTAQGQLSAAPAGGSPAANVAAPKAAPVSPEVQFSQDNQAHIVSSVHTQLLPNGGSMQIRLDPPELGAMSVSVHMRNGVMTATFDTSTEQAARLLTHNLGQLKTALESQGVSVGSLHVQQTPRDSQSNSRDSGKENDGGANDQTGQKQQQDQQRREMLRRMWRRLSGENDPLDMVA